MGRKDKPAAPEEHAPSAAENIKVLVRCRPLNEKELNGGYKSCVDLNLAERTVQVNHVCGNPDRWTFDAVINNTLSQRDIFTQYIMPLVDSVLEGFNATVFAYGQSGSGKTHTMSGTSDEEGQGIIPRTFNYIFDYMKRQQETTPNRHFSVYCSYIELYNGKVRDLLARQQVPLAVKENKDKTFYVQGAIINQVKFKEDLMRYMEEGADRRQVSSTELNQDSSRSHSVFSMIMECTETSDDGDVRSVTSKLNLVDLAGSERQSKTGAEGDTLKEGCNINLSLSALGTVIDTLVKGHGHVPFRSSPLTMLLKDSLGGTSKTVMFANIGPSEHNLSETVSTLRFADRAKQIKNKPVVNIDSKDQKIAELTEQIHELKEKLKSFESGGMADLEKQLEELRDHNGTLEIELDNAVKGREADALDAQHKQQQLETELQNLVAERAELRDHLNTIEQDLKYQAACVEDERKQREEVWTVVRQTSNGAITDIDSLVRKLNELQQGTESAEHLQLQSDHNALVAELRSEKEQRAAQVAELNAKCQSADEECKQALKKLEKMKEKLEKEKDARKQLVESHEVSPMRRSSVLQGADTPQWAALKQELEDKHSDEVAELNDVVERLEDELKNNKTVQSLQQQLQSVNTEKNSTINSLTEQLKKAQEALSQPSSNDSYATANLKQLLQQSTESLTHSRKEIETLEQQIEELRQLRVTRAPSFKDFNERRETMHLSNCSALRQETDVVVAHRDKLLQHIIVEGAVEPLDLRDEVSALDKENQSLREKMKERAVAAEKAAALERDAEKAKERVAELESEATELRARRATDSEQSVVKELKKQLNALQAQLEAVKAEKLKQEAQFASLLMEPKEGEDSTAENGVNILLAMLQKDKAAMADEIVKLSREVSALNLQIADGVRDRTGSAAISPQKTGAPSDALQLVSSSPQMQSALNDAQDALHKAETELHSKSSVFAIEKAELQQELDAAKQELQDEAARRQVSEKNYQQALQEVTLAKQDLSQAQLTIAQMENKLNEQNAETARTLHDVENSTNTIRGLEERLSHKQDQLCSARTLLEQQKQMLDQTRANVEELQRQLAKGKVEQIELEARHKKEMQDHSDSMQRLMNQRIEELTLAHHAALAKKDQDIQEVKKKVKKAESRIEKMKDKFDKKVFEYEELKARMEEQKVDAMRMMKESNVVLIEDSKEQIKDALQNAKEIQRRKQDMFEKGEVTSALSRLRCAGNPALVVQQSKRQGSARPAPPSEARPQPSPRSSSGSADADF